MIGYGNSLGVYLLNPYIYGGAAAFTNEKSLLFDGVNEFLIKSGAFTEFDGATNITYSFWVKFNTLSNYDAPFGRLKSGDSNSESMNVHADGTCDFVIAKGTLTYGRAGSGTFTTGTWYHIAICYDGNETGNSNRLKVYKDGSALSLSFTGTIPATLHTNDSLGRFVIGAKSAVANYMDGYVDEFSIFNYTLDSSQVTSLYNSGTPTDVENTSGVTAPVHWWRMGDDSGDDETTIYDQIGSVDLIGTNLEAGDIQTDVP